MFCKTLHNSVSEALYPNCWLFNSDRNPFSDLSKQQMRAFSESTPPPVPKKRLVRSLSLPATDMHLRSPLSLLSPRQRHPQNFDNPLYMMAQIPDTFFTEEAEDIRTPRGSPDPLLSLTQLSFDTPDEHLTTIFRTFEDQQVVSQGIQHRHLLSLRSMAESVEARSLLQGEAAGRGGSSYQLQDFLQCESREPKQIGDSIYYSLCSPEFPKRVLGLKVNITSLSLATRKTFEIRCASDIVFYVLYSYNLEQCHSCLAKESSNHVALRSIM